MAKLWLKRLVLAILVLLLVTVLGLWFFLRGSLAQLDGRRTVAGLSGNVTVVRDDNGVPSISGGDRNDVAYATGFVHAQDRFFQMDLLRRMPAGELSELFGEKALETDRINRLHRFRARATQAIEAMPAADRQLLERYTAFTRHRKRSRFFRVWHLPWEQAPARIEVAASSLLESTGGWWETAEYIGANYSPGAEVWMGRPHRIA